MSALLSAALSYAQLGYRVFPCVPHGKAPLTAHGHLDATTDTDQIARWWHAWPDANIAVSTARLVVVDIDGPWPFDAARTQELAPGAVSLTPRGRHLWFRRPPDRDWRCSVGQLADGVDVRTDGGYVVVPPSRTARGAYTWCDGCELREPPHLLPAPPAWLCDLLDHAAGQRRVATQDTSCAASDQDSAIREGARNTTLTRFAGAMRRVGMSGEDIAAALLRINASRCKPPLDEAEVRRIAKSVARYAPETDESVEPADDEAAEPEPAPTMQLPPHLLHVPGFVERTMSWCLATAPYPETTAAFAAALSLQAALASRRVSDEWDNRTNLYVLCVAGSGVGKEHARQCNARLLCEAGAANMLGGSFGSGEGIEDFLATTPCALFQPDEFDGLLLRVSRAADARHEQIVSVLLQMYSASSGVYVMRARANRARAEIDQPGLSLFATCLPRNFYASLSQRMLTNGFLSRFLVFVCGPRGAGQERRAGAAVPQELVAAARKWLASPGAGDLAYLHPRPQVLRATKDAVARFRAYQQQIDDDLYRGAERANDELAMALWSRAYEKARRLALVHACSEQRTDIGETAAQWACELSECVTRQMLAMARAYAAEDQFDARCKRLLDFLRAWSASHGGQPAPFWAVRRAMPWTLREHEEVREALVSQRRLVIESATTSGRPRLTYRLPVQP